MSPPVADRDVRAALTRGPLQRDRRHWRFERRMFNHGTVNRVIAAGDAVRQGDTVIATEPTP